jgi:hypothetical protein
MAQRRACQHLHRDIASESNVRRPIHVAHASAGEQLHDAIRPYGGAGRQRCLRAGEILRREDERRCLEKLWEHGTAGRNLVGFLNAGEGCPPQRRRRDGGQSPPRTSYGWQATLQIETFAHACHEGASYDWQASLRAVT